MRKFSWLLYLPILILCLTACGHSGQQQVNTAEVDLTEFYEFYSRFHRDSLFQINHIVFPLKGLPNEADAQTIREDNFYWQKEDWVMHRPIDFEMSEFRREIIPLSDGIIMEKIINKKVNYGLMRRFAKVSGEWHLIYYAGVNHFKQ